MEATVQRKTLTMEDRKVLSEMWAAGERAAVIAVKLGVCPDTVYKLSLIHIWGYHKADPENARAQFTDMFQDYGAYIADLDAAMESAADGNMRYSMDGDAAAEPSDKMCIRDRDYHPGRQNHGGAGHAAEWLRDRGEQCVRQRRKLR